MVERAVGLLVLKKPTPNWKKRTFRPPVSDIFFISIQKVATINQQQKKIHSPSVG